MAQPLSNLPVGAKVIFGKYQIPKDTPREITWCIAAKNHQSEPAYPENSVTLVSEYILERFVFDAKEPANPLDHRTRAGNNRYILSNIDQWLNSDAGEGEWFAPSHQYDAISQEDEAKGGFLHWFDVEEKANILTTGIRVSKDEVDGGGTEDVQRKIYLLSANEVGVTSITSMKPSNEGFLICTNIPKVPSYSLGYAKIYKPSTSDSNTRPSWLRSIEMNADRGYEMFKVQYESSKNLACYCNPSDLSGVRPALNLSGDTLVSDTMENGYYSLILNKPPSVPSFLNVPGVVYSSKENTISWGKSTDPEGENVLYSLERSYDGENFSEIYSGENLFYSEILSADCASVQYRVRACDEKDLYCEYVTSEVRTVVHNQPPEISGKDENLGAKSAGFVRLYSVSDAENDIVTVTEKINDTLHRTYTAEQNVQYAFDVTGDSWVQLPVGNHILTILAQDSYGNTAARNYMFQKISGALSIQNTIPFMSETMPVRIYLEVDRLIPPSAEFKVEVCNNGYDELPTWENATSSVLTNLVHIFKNSAKTSERWGVLIRILVKRNGAEGSCWISGINGKFE